MSHEDCEQASQWRDNRIAELEAALKQAEAEAEGWEFKVADIGIEWSQRSRELNKQIAELADKYERLEAQCAALREALIEIGRFEKCESYGEIGYLWKEALEDTDAGAALLKRLQAAEAVCESFYSDYFEAINMEEEEEDFPEWCVNYRKWRELKTGKCAIHMEECDCLTQAKGE